MLSYSARYFIIYKCIAKPATNGASVGSEEVTYIPSPKDSDVAIKTKRSSYQDQQEDMALALRNKLLLTKNLAQAATPLITTR